ncbi:MAG: tRNA 2-thiouridine(34) synthase MnmA [Gammaproteobacteria bacterium]|nr:tRNA 2-thiouridine(34) synthase MnmA [Gammaproteobacteria bacterium]MDD9895964.1 tRNA 2-thiouridine(34) synthase MnmA [Gammaproteobacteria bacterium]MDD9958621.1 tRNA 2-thiouridine(34) synthase MnmA [Gammaproteobacteria bacterium]
MLAAPIHNVIVGMSGGVDSSVAAYMLQQQGFHVEGLFMKNWEEDDGTEYCTAKEDLADAQAVCDVLGIQLHTANFSAEYWDNVFAHFLKEYRAGRTPNPDVLCNREIKFKAFLEYATELGADFIATGHYVRKSEVGDETYLLKGIDSNKDQSYFLCEVNEGCLHKSLFPLGALPKSDVRKVAADLHLRTHDKKDSTGICFIGERKFKDFLEQYLPAQPGAIETNDGEIIGRHAGLMFYTYGQRQGLGIGGLQNKSEDAWYVISKDLNRNVLIVAQGNENEDLFSTRLIAQAPHWINQQHPALPLRCSAKIRYRQEDQDCLLKPYEDSRVEVIFEQPQRAVTPGQYIVFYQAERCLGGAIIEQYCR